jgi:hypothetical protein
MVAIQNEIYFRHVHGTAEPQLKEAFRAVVSGFPGGGLDTAQ